MELPKKWADWDWHTRYFEVGDEIVWQGPHHGEPIKAARVTRVHENRYSRISYYVHKQMIMMEDVRRATGQQCPNPRTPTIDDVEICPYCQGTGLKQ